MKSETKEAFFNRQNICSSDRGVIDKLKRGLKDSPTDRYRFCLHTSTDSAVQEMLIAMSKKARNAPHAHREGSSESFHIIEGELDVYFFDNSGNIINKQSYGNVESGKPFICRVSEPVFHMPVAISDVVIYHEVVTGPYSSERDTYPDWCPPVENTDEFDSFVRRVTQLKESE